jgi:predicted ATP-grasp superfamily ATP-dependent carboligase
VTLRPCSERTVSRQTIVVAGLWVRPMAQSARRAEWDVIGLDLFGDRDTRAACVEWRRIGDPSAMTIDRAALRAAWCGLASRSGVVGCVLGSGFEGRPELVDDVPPGVELIGIEASRMAAVRDPGRWFDALDRLDLAHPPVAFGDRVPQSLDAAWLVKDARGSGGWHIREAAPGTPIAEHEYLQRRVEGRSMSALFLADRSRACIVGASEQDSRLLGALPFVYQGATGPIRDDAITAKLQRGLDALVPALGLVGLASVDVLATSRGLSWLEINPRPSATMLLYDHVWPQGLMHAHVQACAGRLPDIVPRVDGMTGHRVVFADHAVTVDASLSDVLVQHPWCHDVPMPGTRVGAANPLCSVSARAPDAATLRRVLEQEAADVARLVFTTGRR